MDKYELAERYQALGDEDDLLAARDYGAAGDVIGTGLGLAPGDPKLTADRGQVKAAQGDPDGVLADWRRAHELDPEDFAPVYASRD
jgi:hypothetical protein